MCFCTAPSAPLNLTFPPGGVLNDSITLTWSTPQHPNGVVRFYVLQWSSFGVNFFVNTTTTTIVLSDLTPGTQYTFSVRAFTVAFGPFSDRLIINSADGEEMQHRMWREKVLSWMSWTESVNHIALISKVLSWTSDCLGCSEMKLISLDVSATSSCLHQEWVTISQSHWFDIFLSFQLFQCP